VDVIVVGAGIVGAACAHALSGAGLRVTVLDRGAPAGATTASGEGNVLVSDKAPGPELQLALASVAAWPTLLASLADELGAADVEWDAKGGLVVATTAEAAGPLREFAAAQAAAGVAADLLDPAEALLREPALTPDLALAVHYPADAQLQPVLATTALLAAVRGRGGVVRAGVTVTGLRRGRRGAIRAVSTTAGDLGCDAVLNAAGPWAGGVAARLGAPVAVRPRRGTVLVTAPLPPLVRHKVYDGDYVGAVGSDDAGLATSAVVESTRAGTVLIGSSRERVGFDATIRVPVLAAIAAAARRLFPALGGVVVQRAYGGFRPYVADHLPVIGPDPRLPGLWHATGHEGAGIGLAPATGRLVADLMTGTAPAIDPTPFRVDRPAVLDG